jgi:ubiquinol-cytochrome c reductase cytochrome b subunit
MGEFVAGLLQGGTTLGALTLVRWYAAHVFLLPAALIGLVLAHLALMRRHGISGPIVPVSGEPKPFYPYHAFKDTIAGATVLAGLFTLAILLRAPLEPMADPTDATYIPRPEWYFLSLFELLKYFPGPLEPVATVVIPGLVVALLLLLPFIDRTPERRFLRRPLVAAGFAVVGSGIVVLTALGFRDMPERHDPAVWTPLAIAGSEFVQDARCQSCHVVGGAAGPIATTRLRREPEWLLAHVRDPQIIAPGLREPPMDGMSEGQARSVLSYMRKVQEGAPVPQVSADTRTIVGLFGRWCASCHMIDGEGASSAPDLTRAGAERDAQWLHDWIYEPEAVDPFANMPAFGSTLSEEEMKLLVDYLAARR